MSTPLFIARRDQGVETRGRRARHQTAVLARLSTRRQAAAAADTVRPDWRPRLADAVAVKGARP
jgi:hypothetical protein